MTVLDLQKMSIVSWILGSLVLSELWMWTLVGADTRVFCVFMKSCILPCSFQTSTDVIVHWIQVTAGDLHVHSYYQNQDQLISQDRRFRNRTSLFEDQISRGNASLQLTGVQVQDEGRYRCFSSTIGGNKESFINLKVDAPVREINIEQLENRITCSLDGIYPEPVLIWSTNPPSSVIHLITTRVQQNEQQLYNISSSLSDTVNDLDYTCTISTRRNKGRVTLFKPTSISGSSSETSVPCTTSNTSLTGFNLIWRFNHSQIILNRTRTDVPHTVSVEWKKHVKSLSESGNLMLQDLTSDHEGTYTCELINNEETLVTNVFLRIEKSTVNSVRVGGFIGGVVLTILVTAAAGFLMLYCKNSVCKGQEENKGRKSIHDSEKTKNQNETNEAAEEDGDVNNPLLQPGGECWYKKESSDRSQ